MSAVHNHQGVGYLFSSMLCRVAYVASPVCVDCRSLDIRMVSAVDRRDCSRRVVVVTDRGYCRPRLSGVEKVTWRRVAESWPRSLDPALRKIWSVRIAETESFSCFDTSCLRFREIEQDGRDKTCIANPMHTNLFTLLFFMSFHLK